jgi:N-acetylglucosamine-6-phosphate deacetylase
MEKLKTIASYAKIFPVIITMAPEKFTEEEIDYLLESGVILSLGHTNATYEEVQNILNKDALITVTHLYNAMTGLTARSPGMIGAVLNNPNCYAGIITDLFHVHKACI